MEEIFALQRQLAAAQDSTSSAKLSERNVIELVAKLRSLALVDLIFTRTGKEFLTPTHLAREVQDEIFVRGGRVNVIDLPDALNVDLAHIHSVLPSVLAASAVPTRVVNGEIVTDDYLAALAADIDAALRASATGIDSLGVIASRSNLPVEVVRACVRAHLGSTIAGTVDESSGVLRSHASRVRAAATSRGALRAIATPTVLGDLVEGHDVPVDVVVDLANEMLTNGQLRGRLEGSGIRALFTPSVYELAAHDAAMSRFASSGFLTADMLRSTGVCNLTEFARRTAGGAGVITVGSVSSAMVVAISLIETIESSALEAIETGSWLDISAAMPPDFPTTHVSHIVNLLDYAAVPSLLSTKTDLAGKGSNGSGYKGATKRKTKSASTASASLLTAAPAPDHATRHPVKLDCPILRDQFLISRSILDRCAACIQHDAHERAKIHAKKLTDSMTVVGGSSVSRSGGDDGNADTTDAMRVSKNNKPRRRKGSSGAGKASSAISAGRTVDVPSIEDVCVLLKEDQILAEIFTSDYLGNPSADEAADLVLAIAEDVLHGEGVNMIEEMYEAAAAAAVVEMKQEQSSIKANTEKQILLGLEQAELFGATASTLDVVASDAAAASREHVLETVCRETALRVLNLVAIGLGISSSETANPVTADAIRQLFKQLPSDVAARARPLVSSVTAKPKANVNLEDGKDRGEGGVDGFLKAYDDCSPLLDLPERRPLDKKRERACCASIRASYENSLDKLNTIEALRVSATLLHARCHANGAVVSVPPDRVIELCAALEKSAKPEAARMALAEFRKAVVDDLRSRPEGAPPLLTGNLLGKLDKLKPFSVAGRSAGSQQ
jgi:E3 UFM1-protein ligase 1